MVHILAKYHFAVINPTQTGAWFDCSHRTLRSQRSRSPWQFCYPEPWACRRVEGWACLSWLYY